MAGLRLQGCVTNGRGSEEPVPLGEKRAHGGEVGRGEGLEGHKTSAENVVATLPPAGRGQGLKRYDYHTGRPGACHDAFVIPVLARNAMHPGGRAIRGAGRRWVRTADLMTSRRTSVTLATCRHGQVSPQWRASGHLAGVSWTQTRGPATDPVAKLRYPRRRDPWRDAMAEPMVVCDARTRGPRRAARPT